MTSAPRARRATTVLLGVLGAALLSLGGLTASPSTAAASGCWSSVGTDVDGGGPDVIVGLPSYDLPGKPDAGAVVIYSNVAERGSGSATAPAKATLVTADDIGGTGSEGGARFGTAVVVVPGYAEPDPQLAGCASVLIGSPGASVSGLRGAGRVDLVQGTPTGLDHVRFQFDQDQWGVAGRQAQVGAAFGTAITAQTANQIAIGAPGYDIDGVVDAGLVLELGFFADQPDQPGYLTYIEQLGDQPGNPGDLGTPQPGDRVGEVLDIVSTPSQPMLLVGMPHKDVAGKRDAGAVGLSPLGSAWMWLMTQDTPGAADHAEAGDHFGASLDHRTTRDHDWRHVQVAIGVPGEGSTRSRAGAVDFATFDYHVHEIGSVPWADQLPAIDGEAPMAGSAVTRTQAPVPLPGLPRTGTTFGSSVLLGSFGATTGEELVASAPQVRVGPHREAGVVGLFPITTAGQPSPGSRSAVLTEATSGAPGTLGPGDRFGASATTTQLTHPADSDDAAGLSLLVTAPGKDVAGVADAGAAYLGVPGAGMVLLTPPVLQAGAGRGMSAMVLADCRPLRLHHSGEEPVC